MTLSINCLFLCQHNTINSNPDYSFGSSQRNLKMNLLKCRATNHRLFNQYQSNIRSLFYLLIILLIFRTVAGHAGTADSTINAQMSVEAVAYDVDRGYGYKLQYYVAAPIDVFWRFKIAFAGDFVKLPSGSEIRLCVSNAITRSR